MVTTPTTDRRKFVSTKQKKTMDKLERKKTAEEAYNECQQALKLIESLNQDLIGPYSENDKLWGYYRSQVINDLSDTSINLNIALLHLKSAIKHISYS